MMPTEELPELIFTHLPAFARLIRDSQLEPFVKEQLRVSREVKLPVLEYFKELPDDRLIEMFKISSHEFLTYLVENRASQQIASARERWLTDQLPRVTRDQVVAEDVTLISYIRKQAFLSFLPAYTGDPGKMIATIQELDRFMLESETALTNTYIRLLKDRINDEIHLKEKIIDTSPGNVYIFDFIQQKEVYSNARLNGHPAFSGRDLKQTGSFMPGTQMHPDDVALAQKNRDNLLQIGDGEIQAFEYRIKAHDGSYRWHRSYESVFRRTETGEVYQSIGIAFDIQDEKNIAEQLRYREEQLLEAQELSGIGSFEWDLGTREAIITPQVHKILELKKGDQLSGFLKNVHPSDRTRIQQAMEDAVKEKDVFDAEYRYMTSTGEKIIWSKGTVAYTDGRPIMKGTVMDITDRHYMLQRLQRSEELHKQAQALTHIGNYTLDLATGKLVWSDELYRIYELDPKTAEIDRVQIASYNHPDDLALIEESIGKAISTHQPFDFYYRIILPGNKIKILQARGEVLVDETGNAYKLLGTAQDVTERQELIERLQQSEDLYKQAQALTHIGNWSWDVESGKITWSDELYRIYALSETDISFKKFISLVHPEDRELILQHMYKQHDLHYRIRLPDGTIKFIHGKGEVLYNNGIARKMIGTSQDVTEEKMIEKQLRDNQTFIQKIADATPTIIASYNIHSGNYVFINQGIEKLLGYRPEMVFEQGVAFFATIIHPEDVAMLMEKNSKALEEANTSVPAEGSELIVEFQYRMRHVNGDYRWFHTYGTVFDRNAAGKVEHVLNISIDITERMEAERVLFEKNMELRQSNASLEEFAYVASHDLQEPLRKISTFGDRLLTTQRKNLDEDGKTYLEKIITSSMRMQKMINDLLSISMISGDKAFQPYSLEKIFAEVLQTLEHKIDEHHALIEAGPLPEANVVPSQFRQLFQNLLSNSLKFARPGITLHVTIKASVLKAGEVSQFHLSKAQDYHKIIFSDNGIGFNEIFADKIFAIFQRLHTKSEYEGTGIGLAICKKILENHGGVITARGVQGRGASFTIIFPK